MQPNPIVSQDEWLAARRALLAKEKEACPAWPRRYDEYPAPSR